MCTWRNEWWKSSIKYLKRTSPGKGLSPCLHTHVHVYVSPSQCSNQKRMVVTAKTYVAQQYRNQMYAQTCCRRQQQFTAISNATASASLRNISHTRKCNYCFTVPSRVVIWNASVKWRNLSILYLLQMRHLQIRISVLQSLILGFSVSSKDCDKSILCPWVMGFAFGFLISLGKPCKS